MGALAFTYVCMRAHLSVGGNIASGTTTRATPGKALPRRERCSKPQRPPACPQRQAYRKHDRVAPPLSDPHFRVACDQPVRTQRKAASPAAPGPASDHLTVNPRRWGFLPNEKPSHRDILPFLPSGVSVLAFLMPHKISEDHETLLRPS